MYQKDFIQDDLFQSDVFPQTVTPAYSYVVEPVWRTERTAITDGDYVHRKKKGLNALNIITMRWKSLTESEITALYDFFMLMCGGFGGFAFFCFDDLINYTAVSMGTGDGSKTDYNLKAKSTSGLAVYVDEVLQTLTTDYTIGTGTGTDGQDDISFVSAPASGAVITADYQGRKYYERCVFINDSMSRERFITVLYTTGLVIQEIAAS